MTFRRKNGLKPKLTCGEGITEQHHKDECDIHYIMKQYEETGIVTHTNNVQGSYADFLGVPDFQEAQQAIADAKSMFQMVPAKIRAAFENDPGKFVEFMTNPENIYEIEQFGLNADHLKPLDEALTITDANGDTRTVFRKAEPPQEDPQDITTGDGDPKES